MFRKLRRYKQELPQNECIEILKKEKRAALSVNGEDGYPYVVPINFYYDEETQKIYFHSSRKGQKIEAIEKNDKVCFTVWEKGEKRDDWSYYVRSVIIFGRAKLIKDESLALEKIKKFALKYYPTEEEVDHEIKKDFKAVQMVEITIENICGKLVHEK